IVNLRDEMLGVKSRKELLTIYSNKKPSGFKHRLWHGWFGGEHFESKQLDSRSIYESDFGYTIAWNDGSQSCTQADIQVNINTKCEAGKIAIDYNDFKDAGSILIFCSRNSC